MPDQLSRAEFAAAIKAKHPAYAKVPDDQLVDRILEKYPVYRSKVASPSPQASRYPEGHPLHGYDESDIMGQPVMPMGPVMSVGRAAMGIGGRLLSGAKTAGQVAAPMVKYEAVKNGLQYAGVPAPVATVAATVAAGYRRGAKPTANPNAGGRLVPKSTQTVERAVTEAVESARAPQRPMSVSLPEQGRGPSVTMSPAAQAAASGRVTSPSGAPAARAASSPVASTPRPAPAAPATPATSPAAPKWSPQRLKNEVGLAARRQNTKLTEQEYQVAEDMVRQGVTPADAVKTVAQHVAKPAAAPKLKMNVEEGKLYMRLRSQGKSHEEAAASIQALKQMSKGLPSSTAVDRAVAERNATGRWTTP